MPPSESHDEFLELCAIATTGFLSAEERKRLNDHLPQCPDCRRALEQYEAVIAEAIPALASTPSFVNAADDSARWSLEQAEASLFARLDEDSATSSQAGPNREQPIRSGSGKLVKAHSRPGDALWRHMWWQYAAGLLLVASLGLSLYRIGIRRGAETAQSLPPATHPEQTPAEAHSSQPTNAQSPPSSEAVQYDAQMAALRTQLEDKSAEIAHLKAQQAEMEKGLGDRDEDRTRLAQERADMARQLELAQASLQTSQQKLDAVAGQRSEDEARVAALQAKVNDLSDTIHGRDQEIARERELLDHDRDIRELMGSRDLYIAEVYDVAKTGDTQKPFGRVFYTKGKSLIFYAYDLDQQQGIKSASTFQAWGRRGPDREQAINLGIFYQDNANKKRWVLKSSNPGTLAQIDAVFVTVEPDGGSPHPSGRPLLFAYLRIEPNHP